MSENKFLNATVFDLVMVSFRSCLFDGGWREGVTNPCRGLFDDVPFDGMLDSSVSKSENERQ